MTSRCYRTFSREIENNAFGILEICNNILDGNVLKNSGILFRIFYRLVQENFKNSIVNIKRKSYSLQSVDSNPSLLLTMTLIPNDLSFAYNEWNKDTNKIITHNCLEMHRITAAHFNLLSSSVNFPKQFEILHWKFMNIYRLFLIFLTSERVW